MTTKRWMVAAALVVGTPEFEWYSVLLVMLVALSITGFAIAFVTGRRPPAAATGRARLSSVGAVV